MTIETPRLKLIPCDVDILKAAVFGDAQLAKILNVSVQKNWTEFGTRPLEYSLNRLANFPEEKDWWTYLPLHKSDNTLIGSGGYKGKPNNGTVEIGYEIVPQYRNQGLATEMAKGLIDHAFKDPRVNMILAHTLGFENPSTSILQKCGFIKTQVILDPEDGLIWEWELKKPR